MDQRGRSMKRRRRLSRRHPRFLAFCSFSRCLSLARSCTTPKSQFLGFENRSPAANSSQFPPKSQAESSDPDPQIEFSDEEDEPQHELEMVQADFGFFDPKPGDFHGLKLLLKNYLDDRPWDLSGFVDLILEQTTVGTVVKSDNQDEGEEDDDDGLYAVISALNLQRYAGQQCIIELKKYLLEVCSDESTKKRLKKLLEEQAGDVGLLVSQRFVNCPHELVPPLHDAIFDEVSWATEDEPTQELRDSFRFKFYLILTRIYMHKNVNQRKARPNHAQDEPVIYIKPEDEIFHELSVLSFTFRSHAEQLAPQLNYKEMGLVIVFKADEVPKFRERLKSLLDDS